jgi:TMEM175 potassium channel family protein
VCDTLADHLFTPQNAAFLLIDRIAGEVGPPDVAPMIRTTMKDQERSARSLELGTARVEAFSDAVMAVIITILAFQLQAPRGATLGAVRDQLPGLLVYVLSFMFVGIYWNNHHHLFRAADRISGAAMWANLFLLFWLSLIPVLTEWLRDEYRHALPAAAYGAVALAAGLAYAILVRALIRANGRESAVAKAIGSDLKGYASLGLDAAGVGLALVSPWISYALYVAVSIMWFVPDRRFTRS